MQTQVWGSDVYIFKFPYQQPPKKWYMHVVYKIQYINLINTTMPDMYYVQYYILRKRSQFFKWVIFAKAVEVSAVCYSDFMSIKRILWILPFIDYFHPNSLDRLDICMQEFYLDFEVGIHAPIFGIAETNRPDLFGLSLPNRLRTVRPTWPLKSKPN